MTSIALIDTNIKIRHTSFEINRISEKIFFRVLPKRSAVLLLYLSALDLGEEGIDVFLGGGIRAACEAGGASVCDGGLEAFDGALALSLCRKEAGDGAVACADG